MTPAQIIAQIRDETNTTTDMIPDNTMYSQLNNYYYQVWSKVVSLDRNYGRWSRTANVVKDVNQYDLKPVDNSTPSYWQYRIEKVSIKIDPNDKVFTKLEKRDRDQLIKDESRYAKYQDEDKPFFILSDQSIFVYPTPTKNITDWLVLEWPKKPYALTSWMTENDILIPAERHYVLVKGMKVYVYTKRNLINEKNDALAEFNAEVFKMETQLQHRETSPVYLTMWDMTQFEY